MVTSTMALRVGLSEHHGKELVPVVLACAIWESRWSGHHELHLHDNL